MSDSMMEATLYKCGECEQIASDNAWMNAWHGERLRRSVATKAIEEFEWTAENRYGMQDLMVCPHCKFVHDDSDGSWVEEITGVASAEVKVEAETIGPGMVDLEELVGNITPNTMVIEAIAAMVGIADVGPELQKVIVRELHRARILANGRYSPIGQLPDDPSVCTAVGFLQGVTFASAVGRIRRGVK